MARPKPEPDRYETYDVGGTRVIFDKRERRAVARLFAEADADELLALLNRPDPAPPVTKAPLRSWPSAGTATRKLLDAWAPTSFSPLRSPALTVAQAAKLAGVPLSGATPTVTSAVRAGYLADTGAREPVKHGPDAVVYRITATGLAARADRLVTEPDENEG